MSTRICVNRWMQSVFPTNGRSDWPYFKTTRFRAGVSMAFPNIEGFGGGFMGTEVFTHSDLGFSK